MPPNRSSLRTMKSQQPNYHEHAIEKIYKVANERGHYALYAYVFLREKWSLKRSLNIQ